MIHAAQNPILETPAVEFTGVSKSFSRHGGRMLIRGHLSTWLKHRGERFQALKNISFRVRRSEGVAVIGTNGAGKSTLLSLTAGLARPDSGVVRVRGRVAALLELGSGFHYDLTGAENLELNAALLGLSSRRTRELHDSIVDFAGVGDFIHEPLRTYSSGMVMRLAFSIVIHLDPDILLIDEVIAVGDQAFQAKCFDKMREFRDRGKALLCVSHAPGIIQQLCERVIWLDHGEIVMDGAVGEVLDAYRTQAVAGA